MHHHPRRRWDEAWTSKRTQRRTRRRRQPRVVKPSSSVQSVRCHASWQLLCCIDGLCSVRDPELIDWRSWSTCGDSPESLPLQARAEARQGITQVKKAAPTKTTHVGFSRRRALDERGRAPGLVRWAGIWTIVFFFGLGWGESWKSGR